MAKGNPDTHAACHGRVMNGGAFPIDPVRAPPRWIRICMPAPPGHADTRLLRGISRWALVAFSINLTVGAGILGLQGRMQALVGNYSIAVIVACGLLIALIGLCFSEVAR